MSKSYAEVIGDPIAQSKSPAIHNVGLGKLGIDAEYRATLVSAAGLADYFALYGEISVYCSRTDISQKRN